MFGVGYCWQHLDDKHHLRIAPLLILNAKINHAGHIVRDVHHGIVKEPTGQGVIADNPIKGKDNVVFRQDHLVSG